MRRFLVPVLFLATPALANDDFGGLSATGLTFDQTEAVAMEEERLWFCRKVCRMTWSSDGRHLWPTELP